MLEEEDHASNDSLPTTTEEISTTNETENESQTNEPQITNGPYAQSGWQTSGQLLQFPNEQESTTDLVQTLSNSSESAIEQNGKDIETAEPKSKKENAKLVLALGEQEKQPETVEGESIEMSTDDSINNSTDSSEFNGEHLNETSTIKPLAELETTSEPQSETVDVSEVQTGESTNPSEDQVPSKSSIQSVPGAIFIQLADGLFQRIIYLAPPNSLVPVATVPLANLQFQQLIQQSQSQPFSFNPIGTPRVVTFTSQYQAY